MTDRIGLTNASTLVEWNCSGRPLSGWNHLCHHLPAGRGEVGAQGPTGSMRAPWNFRSDSWFIRPYLGVSWFIGVAPVIHFKLKGCPHEMNIYSDKGGTPMTSWNPNPPTDPWSSSPGQSTTTVTTVTSSTTSSTTTSTSSTTSSTSSTTSSTSSVTCQGCEFHGCLCKFQLSQLVFLGAFSCWRYLQLKACVKGDDGEDPVFLCHILLGENVLQPMAAYALCGRTMVVKPRCCVGYILCMPIINANIYIYVYIYVYIYMYIYIYTYVYMYIYIYICVYICICIYIYMYIIYTYVYMYIYTYMYMYISIYVYMYISIYVYMYICIYIYMYICIYVYIYICIDVYIYICIYVYMYICIYVYMYICIYVYMYICIYVYMYM